MLLKSNHNDKKINTNKLDCCIGSNYVNHGTWYVANTSEKCIYCEYCVENNCIDRDNVDKIDIQTENHNCQCQKDHPRITRLVCPLCPAKRYAEYFISLCDNSHDLQIHSKNTVCIGCGIDANGNKYCNKCAHILKCCTNCGENIRSGNKYISELSNIVTRITDLHRRKIWKWHDISQYNSQTEYVNEHLESINNLYIEIMKFFDKIYENMVNKYRNFSATQILQHLIVHEKLN